MTWSNIDDDLIVTATTTSEHVHSSFQGIYLLFFRLGRGGLWLGASSWGGSGSGTLMKTS
jgi:hypothetical protein